MQTLPDGNAQDNPHSAASASKQDMRGAPIPSCGDPCPCGDVDTWHLECYTPNDGPEAEIQKLHGLMAEAVRDFHGRGVLFSAAFLDAAKPQKKRRK